MSETLSKHVFHITERSAFSAALESGTYEPASLHREGFIHCSTRAQISRTAARFFHGREGLVLLCLDAPRLDSTLRYETADGESFPHCYGAIPLDAIRAVVDFPCQADGSFELPQELELFD